MKPLKINLRKSPLSGAQITGADLRRRAYALKLNQSELLAKLFNEESVHLRPELGDKLGVFTARGSALYCGWMRRKEIDLEWCDFVLKRIRRELAITRPEYPGSGREWINHQAGFDHLFNMTMTLRGIVEDGDYGKANH